VAIYVATKGGHFCGKSPSYVDTKMATKMDGFLSINNKEERVKKKAADDDDENKL
jgi:hypothetical protein